MKKTVIFFSCLVYSFLLVSQNQKPSAPGCNPGPITQIASLPYNSGAQTTCGSVDNVTATNAGVICGSSSYYSGEDAVYTFTPTSTGPVGISVTSTGSWVGIMLYQGCPVSNAGTCVGNAQSSAGNQTLCANVTSGLVYYLVIDSWSPPVCNPYTLSISGCAGAPTAGTAVATPTLKCSTYTTNLSLTGAAVPCGITYQWQSGPSSTGPWTNIAGATAQTATANVTATTYYRCVLSCNSSTAASTPATASLTAIAGCGICGIISAALPFTSNGQTTCGQGDDVTSTNVTSICGSSLYYGGEDVVYSFTPATSGPLGIDVTSTGSYMGLTVYQGCPISGGTCVGSSQSSSGTQFFCGNVTAGQTYYAILDSWPSPTCNPYNINIYTCSGTPASGTAAAAPAVACAVGGTVALSVNGSSNGCGATYQWQSAPVSTGPWSNIASATTSTFAATVNAPTCYRRITACGTSSATSSPVCVTIGGGCVTQLGTGVVSVPSLPYTTSGTTCGSGNDLTPTNAATSGCSSTSYFTGEDQVFIFTPTTSGNITISLTSGGTYTGLMLYNTCPLACVGGVGCVANSQSSTGNKNLVACVVAGTTYYLVLDSWATPTCNAYSNLSISAPGAVSPTSNDVCVSPTPINATGSFTGATNVYTPDQPGNLASVFCGSIENNQWFTFTATSSSATFSVSGVSGASCPAGVQVQVFSVSTTGGVCPSCNSFTSVSNPCYNPATLANGSTTATGLTIGQTYYVMVDGNGGSQCNFTIGGWSLAPLPVVLLGFAGESYSSDINKLNWEVSMEKDLDRYIVQKSNNASNFYPIGEVDAMNSSAQSSYDFFDKKTEKGLSYYRLQMVEKDGSYSFSKTIALDNDPDSKFDVNKIFPNPTNSIIYASVQVPSDGSVHFEVTDITGRVIFEAEQNVNAGTNLLKADLQNYQKGIYYIKMQHDNETRVEKFILQ